MPAEPDRASGMQAPAGPDGVPRDRPETDRGPVPFGIPAFFGRRGRAGRSAATVRFRAGQGPPDRRRATGFLAGNRTGNFAVSGAEFSQNSACGAAGDSPADGPGLGRAQGEGAGMDWLAAVDGYCERTGPGLWAEPLNAVTNAAFLVAAAVMWMRVGPRTTGRVLCLVLAAIGLGSLAFHTWANRLTGLLDVAPIAVFILAYVFVATRDFLAASALVAGGAAVAFIPYAAALTPVFGALPFFTVSAFYWPVPVLILGYAVALRGRAPATARGLVIGAAVLVASLAFRSLDMGLCDRLPIGTHFLWHLLNGLMLGWMIEVWRRHAGGEGRAGGL